MNTVQINREPEGSCAVRAGGRPDEHIDDRCASAAAVVYKSLRKHCVGGGIACAAGCLVPARKGNQSPDTDLALAQMFADIQHFVTLRQQTTEVCRAGLS